MNKKIWIGLVCFVFIGVGVGYGMLRDHSDPPAQPIVGEIMTYMNKWAVLPLWDTAPTLDGSMEDTLWDGAVILGDFTTAYYDRPLAEAVQYRAAYDHEHLYIAGHVAKSEADTLAQIEVLLRPDTSGSETYYVVKVPVNPETSPVLNTIWNPSPDVAHLSADGGKVMVDSFRYETSSTDDAFQFELAIPLTAMLQDRTGITPGEEWQLNIIHVHQLYTQPLSSWVPIRNADHWHDTGSTARMRVSVVDQDRWGSIFFGQIPTGQAQMDKDPMNADRPANRWNPESSQLIYTGFMEKQLQFTFAKKELTAEKVELSWKQPGGSWERIDDYELQRDRSSYTVDFRHPAPLADGLYHLQIVLYPGSSEAGQVAIMTLDRESIITAGTAVYNTGMSALEEQGMEDPSTGKEGVDQQAQSEEQTSTSWDGPSDEVKRIMALIPEQPGFTFVGLPEMPDLYPSGLYQLMADGHSLRATRTGTVYPNERYKEDKSLVVMNGKGEEVAIPYYEDEAGQRYFITAHMWYLQKSRAISQTATLAGKDPAGTAWLLYQFALAYERYNPTVDRVAGNNHANLSADIRSGPPYAYWGGIWNRWWYNDLTQLTPLIRAYAQLKGTDVFAQLNEAAGEDVERRIVEGLIVPSAEFVLTYPIYLSNMSFQPWKGLIEVGKALEDPDYIHRVIEYVEETVTRMFLSDGFWQEVTPSYHLQTVAGLREVTNQLRGWTDPEGYISPRTGARFDNLDMEQKFPMIRRAMEIGNKLVYPDGRVLPIMDTWANGTPPQPQINAGSFLLPSTKIGRLVGGQGVGQMQVYLGFQPKYGHVHYDPLNLSIFAERQELLPDLGYSHNTFYRWFALSTMSHNTVVVDSANMTNNAVARHGGNIEQFVPDGGQFQVMRASYESAYTVTDEYSREPWYVPFADGAGGQGYVVDVFRVTGGSRHEYTLQGDANHDAYFATDLPLTEYGPYLLPPGTQVVEPVSNSDSGRAEGHYPGYIYVRDVQQAQLDGDQYHLTLVTERNGTEQAKMKMVGLLEPGDHELFLGRSPSLRSIRILGNSMDNNDEAVKYTMPKLVLRREGTNLQSTFVTVMEPYQEQSRIESAVRLPLGQGPEGAVAVQVRYGDTTDIVLSNPKHPEQPVVVDDLYFQGEMGFIRIVNGEIVEMSLVGGTMLKKGKVELSGSGTVAGTVVDTRRLANGDVHDALVVDVEIPQDMAGRYVIVDHPDGGTTGYEIGEVIHEQGKTILVLAEYDPGFEINADGTSKQVFYPEHHWTDQHTFRIASIDRLP